MKKNYEERILEEIKTKCSQKEMLLINKNKDVYIKVYNIGRLNTINKLLN